MSPLQVYFERASTSLHEESTSDLQRLAEICRRFSKDLVLFVSGHCGRNAPEFIKWLGEILLKWLVNFETNCRN